MKGRKIAFGIVLNVIFSAIMAAVMGLAAVAIGGHEPITLVGFGIGFGIGFVINFIVAMVLPLQKIGDGFCRALGATSKVAESFVKPIIMATIFVLILIFCFTVIQTGFGTLEPAPGVSITFMDRYLSGLGYIWLVAYLAVVFTLPFSFWSAQKITGFPPKHD